MISNAEIERYREFALIRSARKIGSLDEQNLALMVINLVDAIDHLATLMAKAEEWPTHCMHGNSVKEPCAKCATHDLCAEKEESDGA